MNIDIFSEYKVNYKNEYSYISDYEFNEPTYSNDVYKFNKNRNGKELLNLIKKEIEDRETISFIVKDSIIGIEKFNPDDGTSADIIIEIEMIGKDGEYENYSK